MPGTEPTGLRHAKPGHAARIPDAPACAPGNTAAVSYTHLWTGDYHNPQRMNLAVTGVNAENVSIVSNGFQVRKYFNLSAEEGSDSCPYRYIAFK